MDTWLIALRNPLEIWEHHSSFLIGELLFLIQGIFTFRHAYRNKGCWIYLWIAIFLHGFVVELVSYTFPTINNFWHAQATVMLLDKRLPLYVMFIYPALIYTATVSVNKLNLNWWEEPFAVGLLTALLDIPCDMVGVKFLWWTWHDTDPNIIDRTYWVPWTSYYFQAAFASSLIFLFNGFRWLISKKKAKHEREIFTKEIIVAVLTSLLAMPLGILQFIPIYHPLHDVLKIPTEICVYIYLSIFGLITWTASFKEKIDLTNSSKIQVHFNIDLCCIAILYYCTLFTIILFGNPENIISTGIHEPVGNCEEISPVYTPLGMVLSKRKYLCMEDYDEGYYNWNCLTNDTIIKELKTVTNPTWYSICGTAFPNHTEYIIIVGAAAAFGLYIYLQLLFLTTKKLSRKSKVC